MPITLQEIKDHKDYYGLQELDAMGGDEYRKALSDGAFFWIDHHDFVRSTFSGEILATNREQLDALIAHLLEYREKMP